MNTPPIGPKPKSLPHRLLNGSSPLHSTVSVTPKERQKLVASIESSHSDRQPIDFDDRSQDAPPLSNGSDANHTGPGPSSGRPRVPPRLSGDHRDPCDEAPVAPQTVSRPASPYTLNPPIDFDGLSWPSELFCPVVPRRALLKRETQALARVSGLRLHQSKRKSG